MGKNEMELIYKKERKELIEEVNKYGYNFNTTDDILKIGSKDKKIIPVLLKWIDKLSDPSDKSWIARCLTVKGYKEALPRLIMLFKELKIYPNSDRWAVGNAIGVIGNNEYIDEYLEIITDKTNGTDRQMIVNYMYRYKEERVKKILIELLEDEDVNSHAIYALGMFKDVSVIDKIKPFLQHNSILNRRLAKSAIKKLEKLK
ncbi:HEAT repeat domain-containing protein [Streptobacillus canis]|uniref:HEAT repeat domain-containing protein n=1 Tax=Streptobacillus canis TaxID=2678686 RepID=UPI0012E1456B|nr:HEAT repeat domain-containing protein [Streptobacillus canis]